MYNNNNYYLVSFQFKPVLFSLQQFLVGGDLYIQSHFDIHQILVVANLFGHVVFGFLQRILQALESPFSIKHGLVTAALHLFDLALHAATLR